MPNPLTAAAERMLKKALSLPIAKPEYFTRAKMPADARPEHLRVSTDWKFRQQMIRARLVEPLQSPKGREAIKSILRIYPKFDAPTGTGQKKPQQPSSYAPALPSNPLAAKEEEERADDGAEHPAQLLSANGSVRRRGGIPTVEEMEQVLARIRMYEAELGRDIRKQIDESIDHVKRTMGMLDGVNLDEANQRLTVLLAERRQLNQPIREAAFAKIDQDYDFEQRAYLRFLRPTRQRRERSRAGAGCSLRERAAVQTPAPVDDPPHSVKL